MTECPALFFSIGHQYLQSKAKTGLDRHSAPNSVSNRVMNILTDSAPYLFAQGIMIAVRGSFEAFYLGL
jgi:hypothetical protein